MYHVLYFFFGCGLTLLIVYLVHRFTRDQADAPQAKWNAADYTDGWTFYANTPAHPITIQDNMRSVNNMRRSEGNALG